MTSEIKLEFLVTTPSKDKTCKQVPKLIKPKLNRFGEVDKLEFLTTKDSPVGVTAVVSFLSLQIAAKIHKMTHKIANNAVTTRYHDFSSSAASDSKADVKDKRPRNDEFQR